MPNSYFLKIFDAVKMSESIIPEEHRKKNLMNLISLSIWNRIIDQQFEPNSKSIDLKILLATEATPPIIAKTFVKNEYNGLPPLWYLTKKKREFQWASFEFKKFNQFFTCYRTQIIFKPYSRYYSARHCKTNEIFISIWILITISYPRPWCRLINSRY